MGGSFWLRGREAPQELLRMRGGNMGEGTGEATMEGKDYICPTRMKGEDEGRNGFAESLNCRSTIMGI